MPSQDSAVGARIGPFELEIQLGVCPLWASYRAHLVSDLTPVEIRLPLEPEAWKERVLLASLLDIPSIQRIVSHNLTTNPAFLAMEWRSSSTLQTRRLCGPPFDPLQSLVILKEVAAIVAACHRNGLYGLELTPSKIHWDGEVWMDVLRVPPAAVGDGKRTQRQPGSDVRELGNLLAWLVPDVLTTSGRHEASLDLPPISQEAPWRRDLLRQVVELHRLLLQPDPEKCPSASETAARLEQLLEHAQPKKESIERPVEGAPEDENTCFKPVALRTVPVPIGRVEGPADTLGRFRLAGILGRGGMGTVYKAEDSKDGTQVAIKVLSSEYARDPESYQRFQKEARILQEVDSPYIARLLEVNEDRGTPFLAMELVEGENLNDVLKQQGPMHEAAALTVMAEVGHALGAAHQRGIVHRDVKPANIVLVGRLPDERSGSLSDASAPRIKVLDFGLARHIVQSRSMNLTQTGAFLGTPTHMAPEQCMGDQRIDARTDVYAMGITLFQLLIGRPPFESADTMKLITKHCYEKPPALQSLNPSLSDGVSRIVEKCLAKKPEARYADASEVVEAIELLVRGAPTPFLAHPLLPPHEKTKLYEVQWTWDLDGAPAELWPFVSNTERVNKAAHVPAVEYSTQVDPLRGVRRFGNFRLAGMGISWEEHPYEWVEGRRMAILREFSKGPFSWFLSTVELEPRENGGTKLTHRVTIAPRGVVGRLVAGLEVGLKGKKGLDRIYRRIDSVVGGASVQGPEIDPFEATPRLPIGKRKRLDQRLEKLATAIRNPALAGRLGDYLTRASAQEVARIRPLALAKNLRANSDEVLTTCLHAVREGLLLLHWDILCPKCRSASDMKGTLREIEEHARCEVCDLSFQVDFAQSVEMIFQVHPEIRAADLKTYCIGGPEHFPHVVAQLRLQPQERMELELALVAGDYALRGPQIPYAVPLAVDGSIGLSHWEITIADQSTSQKIVRLKAGSQLLSLVNHTEKELLLRLERSTPRKDVVTAAKATTLAIFRELFPDQILSPGQLATVTTMTFLAVDLPETEHLYSELGDAGTFAILQANLSAIVEWIRESGGAVVKVQRDELFAVFGESADAVKAALHLRSAVSRLPASQRLPVRAAVHRGAALVVTTEDRLDYFGASVAYALRLLRQSKTFQIVVSRAVSTDPVASESLEAGQRIGKVLEIENSVAQKDFAIHVAMIETPAAAD